MACANQGRGFPGGGACARLRPPRPAPSAAGNRPVRGLSAGTGTRRRGRRGAARLCVRRRPGPPRQGRGRRPSVRLAGPGVAAGARVWVGWPQARGGTGGPSAVTLSPGVVARLLLSPPAAQGRLRGLAPGWSLLQPRLWGDPGWTWSSRCSSPCSPSCCLCWLLDAVAQVCLHLLWATPTREHPCLKDFLSSPSIAVLQTQEFSQRGAGIWFLVALPTCRPRHLTSSRGFAFISAQDELPRSLLTHNVPWHRRTSSKVSRGSRRTSKTIRDS